MPYSIPTRTVFWVPGFSTLTVGRVPLSFIILFENMYVATTGDMWKYVSVNTPIVLKNINIKLLSLLDSTGR